MSDESKFNELLCCELTGEYHTDINLLLEKMKPFIKAANKMKEFKHDKPPIVHYDDWIRLITPKAERFSVGDEIDI